MNEYTVYSKFDIDKHEKTFINYFEAIINRDGTIEYAVPSHQQILIRKYGEMNGMTPEEAMQYLIERPFIEMEKIQDIVGLVMCWSERYETCRNMTDAQIKTLNMLIERGLTTNER